MPPATPIPKALTLKAGDDLGEAIASAPSGSSITIIESGTFELKGLQRPEVGIPQGSRAPRLEGGLGDREVGRIRGRALASVRDGGGWRSKV